MPSRALHVYDFLVATAALSIVFALHAPGISVAQGAGGLDRHSVENGPTLLHEMRMPLPMLGFPGTGDLLWKAPVAARGAAVSAAAGHTAPAGAALVHETLANGMQVLVMRDTDAPVVAMRAVWRGGLRLETPADNGISMLLATVVTRGCGARDAASLAHRVDGLSGRLSGVAGRNTFGMRAEWPAAHWQAGLSLVADCIIAPRFEAHELARAKRQLFDVIQARGRSLRFEAFRIFAQALHAGHPYGMDAMGAVSGLARQHVTSFYQRHFPVGALTLVIVGDVEPAQVMAQVRQHFGRALSEDRHPRVPASPVREGTEAEEAGGSGKAERPPRSREVYRYLDGSEAHLVIGFPGTTLNNPDRYALQVLAAVLGGPGGRLREDLKVRRALAHRVEAVSTEGVEPGHLAVHLACRPEALAAVFRSARVELARLKGEPVSPEELLRAKSHLLDIHAAASRHPSAVAAALASHQVLGLGYERYLAYEEEIRAVDADAVQRVAAAYIVWDAVVTATVKPPDASPDAARRAQGKTRRMPRKQRAARNRESRVRGR